MATIKEIAKACNVSIATVSNILNGKGKVSEETKKMVMDYIDQSDYVPNVSARNLKRRSTKTIGVITEDLTVFNAPEIVDGIDGYLEENGFKLVLVNLRIYKKYGGDFSYHDAFQTQLNTELRFMKAKQVDGIIYVSAHSRDLSGILGSCQDLPIVVVYGSALKSIIPSIMFDDRKAAYEIVKKLSMTGAENIGVIAGDQKSSHTMERLVGFQKALYEEHIFYDPELVYYGDWSREYGYIAAEKLVKAGIKVIFSMNDIMAAGVYDYASDNGLVIGKDISIGGIGNEIAGYLKPRLATIEFPLYEMGRLAAKTVLEIIDEKYEKKNEVHKVSGAIVNDDGGSIICLD